MSMLKAPWKSLSFVRHMKRWLLVGVGACALLCGGALLLEALVAGYSIASGPPAGTALTRLSGTLASISACSGRHIRHFKFIVQAASTQKSLTLPCSEKLLGKLSQRIGREIEVSYSTPPRFAPSQGRVKVYAVSFGSEVMLTYDTTARRELANQRTLLFVVFLRLVIGLSLCAFSLRMLGRSRSAG